MVRFWSVFLTVVSIALTSCSHDMEQVSRLNEARGIIEQSPDSAWTLLQNVAPSQLLIDDWYDYALLQAKAALSSGRALPDADLVHEAAVRQHRIATDATTAATYYYYATLSYEACGELDAAIADCMMGIRCYAWDERNEGKDKLYLLLHRLVTSRSEAEWIDMQQRLFDADTSVSHYPALFMAMVVALCTMTVSGIRTRQNNQEIQRLQTALAQLQMQQAMAEETGPRKLNADALRLHHELFQKSDAYSDLQQLKYMTDHVVSVNNRTRLMQAVENAFDSDIHTLALLCPELSKEDVFLCMMSLMRFSTHDIAACLGVSNDAVRKRRSRLRHKLSPDECTVLCV